MSRKYKILLLASACLTSFGRGLLGFDDVFFDDDEFILTALFGDCALVNEQWYCVGDNVLGSKFISINKSSIMLDNGSKRFLVYLKKSALNR
ncbi:hypothetical protein [Campylobacter sp. 19-13652]|uniref:hypothetical protein n=1 Tax=Campylobacter sp. 19-13652 TaxID=2840180 RepID=UPI001C74DDC9|nr:hypothetical protein [Campylobacter sp. 19-13652]BCX80169.1 hypothetical protein LBC_16310 [Campylobacter sp. 19-13652]